MEKSGDFYSQYQNVAPTNTLPPSTYLPTYDQSQRNFLVDQKVAENCRRTKRLATVEMMVSCLLLLFGIISTILGTIDQWWVTICVVLGASIWAPVFGIIAAGLGLGALRYDDHSRSCLLISHFVMCIFSALASGILVIFSSICISITSNWLSYNKNDHYYPSNYYRTPNGVPEALMAFDVIILLGAITNMIANIVSLAFICQYLCGRKNGAGTVVYIASQVATGNGAMPAISLPPGAQVIFLPSNTNTHFVQTQVP